MDIQSLQIFFAIKNEKSIAGAAKSLFLSQSTVCYRLSMLEKYLGTRLFYRQKGCSEVSLTESGKHFEDIARKMLLLNESALELKNNYNRTPLTVSVVESLNAFVIPPFYRDFISKHPDVNLTISTNHSWEIFELLEKQTIDVGITNHSSPFSDIKSELLFDEPYVVVKKSMGSPILNGTYIHPTELDVKHEIFQSFSDDFCAWHNYWWKTGQSKVSVNTFTYEALFETSEDWSIVPRSVAYFLSANRNFVYYNLLQSPPKRKCFLSTSMISKETNKSIVDTFVCSIKEWIHNYLRENTLFEKC